MAETAPPSIIDRMKDAAAEQTREQQDERRRVAEIVLGKNVGGYRVTDMVKVGDDYAVEVTDRKDDATWTTVVGGERGLTMFLTQEEAVLHLIARRYDDNPNSNVQAAFYAGRVLGVGTTPIESH